MMNDSDIPRVPAALEGILRDTSRIGFTMASERKTGSLLWTLAASKPAGRFLELGTGTGVGTSWILAGMDAGSTLDSIDNDPAAQEIARRHLGLDSRVRFHVVDGADFLERSDVEPYDFIYADSWPGKFSHLDLTLGLPATTSSAASGSFSSRRNIRALRSLRRGRPSSGIDAQMHQADGMASSTGSPW